MAEATAVADARSGEIAAEDGTRLFCRRWRPEHPVGRVLIVHGLGDHSGRFEELGRWLAAGGLESLAPDLRGHGRSGGRRGHARSFDALLDDLEAHLAEAASEGGALPTVLLGHSLGGLLALRYLQRAPSDSVRGTVAVAPFFELRMEAPAWKLALGRMADRWLPGLTLPSGVGSELVLREPAAREERRSDPLVHDRISARLWGEMRRAADAVRDPAEPLGGPVLLQVAGDDRLVSSEAAEAAAEESGARIAVRRYPGAYHDLLHDPAAEAAARDALAWIRERLDLPGGRGPEPAYRLHPTGSSRGRLLGTATPHDEPETPGATAMDERDPAGEAEEPEEEAAAEPQEGEPADAAAAEPSAEELEELRDRHLRLAAEYDNYRKRTRREMAEARERAQAELAGRLLDALDDLDRFAESTEDDTDLESLREGMELVRRKLWKELSGAGLERMEAEGERFDPEKHDALLTTPVDDPEEDGVVSRVLIAGYRFGDRVLRPARVEVKRHASEEASEEAAEDGAD